MPEDSHQTTETHLPEAEAQLEAFKGALLLTLSRLPGKLRSEFARQVEQDAQQLRSAPGVDHSRLASHLEQFAKTARLVPPS